MPKFHLHTLLIKTLLVYIWKLSSFAAEIYYGVQQGSVSGPLIFFSICNTWGGDTAALHCYADDSLLSNPNNEFYNLMDLMSHVMKRSACWPQYCNIVIVTRFLCWQLVPHHFHLTFLEVLLRWQFVQFNSKVKAEDPDADANGQIKYSIDFGNNDGYFSIEEDTGEITLAKTIPLLENRILEFPLYITARDGRSEQCFS